MSIRRMKRTAEVKVLRKREGDKNAEQRGLLLSMCFHDVKGFQSSSKEEQEARSVAVKDGVKTGPESNPSLFALCLRKTQTPLNPFYQKSC